MKHILTIAFFMALGAYAFAGSIDVFPGNGSPLSTAIARAKPWDSLIVHKGNYKEGSTVTISKPLFLIGKDNPVIDGEFKYEIMVVNADFVTITGFTFRNSGKSSYNDIAALRLLNHGHILVRGNQFENNLFGVYSQHAYYSTIAENHFRSNGTDEQSSANGIHCWRSDHMLIANNFITGHRDGIYFEFVTNSTIIHNKSEKNIRYGLHFMFSSNDRYIQNQFINNGSGVAVMYSKGVHMKGNRFADNWGDAAYGILLKEITDSKVEDNTFSRNTSAIYLEGSIRISIHNNAFLNNGWAIKMQASSTDNIVSGNNFMGNSFDVSTNGSLQLNSFNGNYWDKYEGYDLDRNGSGDVPFRPVSMFSVIVERNPPVMMMFRSFMTGLMDKAEKVIPGITPVDLADNQPLMHPLTLKNDLP